MFLTLNRYHRKLRIDLSRLFIRGISPVVLLSASTVGTLLFIELLLTFYQYQRKPLEWWDLTVEGSTFQFDLDGELIYRPKPNVPPQFLEKLGEVGTDNFGFRFNPLHQIKTNYETEIVLIGDSFTYGSGVKSQSSYPFQLEKKLQDHGVDVIVHNAGVQGYGIDQEYLYFRDVVLAKTHPNIVVWNLNVGDSDDANDVCLFIGQKHAYDKSVSFHQVSALRNSLYWRGVLFRGLPVGIRGARLTNLILARLPVRYTVGCSISRFKEWQRVTYLFLEKLQYLVRQMNALSDMYGFRLIMTISPFQYYFDRSSKDSQDIIGVYSRMVDVIYSEGAELVDSNYGLLLIARKEPGLGGSGENNNLSKTLFLDESTNSPYGWWHLNPKGNELLAEYFSQILIADPSK